jgi:hypothetical protein
MGFIHAFDEVVLRLFLLALRTVQGGIAVVKELSSIL